MKRSAEQSAMKDGYWDNILVHCTVLDRSVQTGTSRSAASALDCCHFYMQQVRNAVALVLLKEQQKAIKPLEPSQVEIYILAFDETEQSMRVNGIASFYHLFMMTGSLSWQTFATAPIKCYPLTARPAVIQNTTAERMWAALMDRSPSKLVDIKTKCQVLVLVLSHDAHRSTVRLGRHFKEHTIGGDRLSEHAVGRCLMRHQPLPHASNLFDHIFRAENAFFSACLIIHQHSSYAPCQALEALPEACSGAYCKQIRDCVWQKPNEQRKV